MIRFIKALFSALTLVSAVQVAANPRDSLEKALQNATTDSARISLICLIARNQTSSLSDPDILEITRQSLVSALTKSREKKFFTGKGAAVLSLIGILAILALSLDYCRLKKQNRKLMAGLDTELDRLAEGLRSHYEHVPEDLRVETRGLLFALSTSLESVRRATQTPEEKLEDLRSAVHRTLALAGASQAFAQQKEDALLAFHYTISHDLKSPLSNADQYLNLLEAKDAAPGGCAPAGHFALLRRLIGEMKQMIDGMSAYAKAENLELKSRHINTCDLVKQIMAFVCEPFPERSIRFHIGELPPLHGDPLLLRQVLTNLLSNAAKFTRSTPEPHIRVSGRPTGDGFVEITVADNGAGIPPEGMHRIFPLFKTAHDRQQFEGTGVGLAIVKRIVERHGGTVQAKSDGVGKGAEFTIRWPEGSP